jgi:hypothetical protein
LGIAVCTAVVGSEDGEKWKKRIDRGGMYVFGWQAGQVSCQGREVEESKVESWPHLDRTGLATAEWLKRG